MRVVVDQPNEILLEILQHQGLTDARALGNETRLLDERDDVGGGDAIVTGRCRFAPRHGSPTASISGFARPERRRCGIRSASAGWRAAGSRERPDSWLGPHARPQARWPRR